MTKETYLHDKHIQLGARMVDFAGWHMPVQYTSIIEEHKTVRENVGLFDVSHMGEVFVSGKDSLAFLQKIYWEWEDAKALKANMWRIMTGINL